MKRVWQTLPEGVRAGAHRGAGALLDRLTPAMVAMAWRRGRPGGEPVAVAGLHTSSIGLGRGARLFTAALRDAGMSVDTLDVGRTVQVASDLGSPEAVARRQDLGDPRGGTLVTHLNPPELTLWLQRTAARSLRGRRHIGYWAWELPALPPAWTPAFAYVDEVWCPSRFTAEAVRAAAPAHVPVKVVAHPVFMAPCTAPDRARFGLASDACVVLTAMDLKSTSARKNPQGAIAAYLRAIPRPDGRSTLVCKLAGGRQAPERLAEVEAMAAGRPDVILMHQALSEGEMSALIASSDIVLSLHRAEGFGLLPAEAMWLGKPVVATAWSGVMDFLDPDSAALVSWTPAPVRDVQAMYEGGWWAEPDLDAAADRLRRLLADPVARVSLGARAHARAVACFDREAWTARVRGLLAGRDQDDRLNPKA